MTEGLVCAIRYSSFLFQTAPGGVIAEPQEIAVLISHLARYADLVAVEVVGLLAAFALFFGLVLFKLFEQRIIHQIDLDL